MLAVLLLLPPLATAAPRAAVYAGPILTWSAVTGFAASADPTDIEIKNDGKKPAIINLVSTSGVELVSLAGPYRVQPGQKLPLRVRMIGPCEDPVDAPPICGLGIVSISGFGGVATLRVEPLPSDMKHVGAPAPRVWWNPDGVPPPLPPPAAVTVLSGVSMELAVGSAPTRFSTKRGDVEVHVTPDDGLTDEQDTTLTTLLVEAFRGCSEARTKPFSPTGETLTVAIGWGSDGVVSGVAADGGLGDKGAPYCMAQALMGKPTGVMLPASVTGRALSLPR